MQIKDLPIWAGLTTFVGVFLGVLWISQSLVISLVMALLLAAVVGALIVPGLFPSGAGLDDYQITARRAVRNILRTVGEINELGSRVKNQDAQNALKEGCRIIPDLLRTVQEKDPTSVVSTAARVKGHVDSIKTTLDTYLEVQANPNYYPDSAQVLDDGETGFLAFPKFSIKSIQQLNQGEIMSYRAGLSTLKPIEIPTIT